MDHLTEAKSELALAGDDWETGHDRSARQRAQVAAVHALIALVERLDTVSEFTGIQGSELRGFRVHTY